MNAMSSVVNRGRLLLVGLLGLVALGVSAVLAGVAQAQTASDLTTPVKNGVEAAMTAGFVIAAAILVGFAIYKIVKRFA